MTDTITAVSWNVQGEIGVGEGRMQRQVDLLDEHAADVDLFLFQAVNSEGGSEDDCRGQLGTLLDYLSNRRYHVVHTGDWARELAESNVQPHSSVEGVHNRCNLVASRWPIERRPLTLRNRGHGKPRNLNYYYSHFPEKMLVAQVDVSDDTGIATDSIEIWNVGIINGAGWGEEKLNMLETVYGRIYLQTAKVETPVLLGGDFNAPKRETADGGIVPHGENTEQYTGYPYYGDPHYLRERTDEVNEFRFDQRWRVAEARIFDTEVGDWDMRDVYWTAEKSRRASSVEDFTHIVHNGTPSRKRLDHVLVSQQFDAYRCEIWNGESIEANGFEASDHAPVFTELGLG